MNFNPPTITDFQSLQAAFLKASGGSYKAIEGAESLYLIKDTQAFKASKMSKAFRQALVARSISKVVIGHIAAATVPLMDEVSVRKLTSN
jgi:hypothetical protein